MAPTFDLDADAYFALLRAQGEQITAEQEAIARRVIAEQNTSGDVYTMLINAIMSAFRGIVEFIDGGDASSLGERLNAAMENGQQRGDMHTAAEISHRIRNELVANGLPADLAARMTGDTTSQPEVAGNLYRQFTADAGISDRNRIAEAQYQQATTRYPVTDNPTVTAPTIGTALNPTLALTGMTPTA